MKPQAHNLILAAALGAILTACSSTPTPQSVAIQSTTEPVGIDSFQPAAAKAHERFNLPNWERTPEQVAASANEAMNAGDNLLSSLSQVPANELTFSNTLGVMDAALAVVGDCMQRIDIIRETHPDKAMRDAAHEATEKLLNWVTAVSFREDIYRVVRAFADSQPKLDTDQAIMLRDSLRDFRQNGMDLPKAKRDQLQALKNRLNELELAFAQNISEANILVEFTAAELDGVSADFLNNDKLKRADGKYSVNANVTWQAIEVLDNAKNEATRHRFTIARNQRALQANQPVFAEILEIRAQIASLLGYPHWADYRIESKMAKSGNNALAFVQTLKTALQPKFDKELETLRQLKIKETGDANAKIQYWDIGYYTEMLKKTSYQVDSNELKVFFELEQSLGGMFGIFEELFDLRIQEVNAPYKWVDDLRLYAVSDSETGAPLGLIYMDMFPRDGKYNHFAQFGITTGRQLADGTTQRPVVALICNFPPATADKPSLLSHDHLETLFHEFGHALHSVLTQARYASQSGTAVPRDFVEAPSQMLEHWVWDKKVLDRFASDYRDPTRKIPAATLDKMNQAKLATSGIHYRRQLAFGLLDLDIHMTQDRSVFTHFTEITNRIMSEAYVQVPDKTGLVASFGHLGGGYDAGYYGYAWADAISADMAATFQKSPGGLMDPEVGRRLRDEIYATGGSREAEDSIRKFLGKERSLDAFYRQIGL